MAVSQMKTIAIGGISRSGKTEMARQLASCLSKKGYSVKVVSLDEYVHPEGKIPKIKDRIDWEHPDSIDWDQVISLIDSEKGILIIEGIFAFDRRIQPFVTINVLIQIDKRTFLERKRIDKRWGEEPDWYVEHIWQSNDLLTKLVIPDHTVDGTVPISIDVFTKHLDLS